MSALEQAEKLAELSSIREFAVGAEAAVSRLAELLADENPEVRAEAAAAVFGYPGEEALVQTALSLAKTDSNESVRAQALGALGSVVSEGDLLGVSDAGYTADPALGAPSAETFRAVRDVLLETLGDAKSEAERVTAIESLSFLSSEDAVVQAIETLADEPASRVAALRCMGRSGDPRWSEAIQAGLEDDEPKVVAAAIEASGRVELVSAIPLLSRILRGSRQPKAQRVQAAEALSRLGGKYTGGVLLEVADGEDDEDVRAAASQALVKLTLLDPVAKEE